MTCWRFVVSLLPVTAGTARLGRERRAWTEGAGAGGSLRVDDVVAFRVGAAADEDAMLDVHFTFFSERWVSSGFFSRKMTCEATISTAQRFWPDSLSSHSDVRSEPSMRTCEPLWRNWETFSPLPLKTATFSQLTRSCFSPAESF